MERRLEQPLAHRAISQRLERRLLRRVLKTQKPLARQATLGRRLGRGGAIGLAQSVEIGRIVDDERLRFRRGEQSLLEFGRERRLFLIQRAKLSSCPLSDRPAPARTKSR